MKLTHMGRIDCYVNGEMSRHVVLFDVASFSSDLRGAMLTAFYRTRIGKAFREMDATITTHEPYYVRDAADLPKLYKTVYGPTQEETFDRLRAMHGHNAANKMIRTLQENQC